MGNKILISFKYYYIYNNNILSKFMDKSKVLIYVG